MEHRAYGLSVTLPVSLDTAVADTTAALKTEGFGVLTSIDVQQTLKTKLNRDFRKCVILGACNQALADRALQPRSRSVCCYRASSSSRLQRRRRPRGGWRALSVHRHDDQPDLDERRDDIQFGVGDWQCASATPSATLRRA